MKRLFYLFLLLVIYSCKSTADYNNGLKYFHDKDYVNSVRVFEDLVLKDSLNSSYNKYCGAAYGELGEYDKALFYLTRAMRLGDKSAQVVNEVGSIYYKTGKIEKAHDAFFVARLVDSTYENVNYNLGLCYYDFREFEKSLRYLQKEILYHPNNTDAQALKAAIEDSLKIR